MSDSSPPTEPIYCWADSISPETTEMGSLHPRIMRFDLDDDLVVMVDKNNQEIKPAIRDPNFGTQSDSDQKNGVTKKKKKVWLFNRLNFDCLLLIDQYLDERDRDNMLDAVSNSDKVVREAIVYGRKRYFNALQRGCKSRIEIVIKPNGQKHMYWRRFND